MAEIIPDGAIHEMFELSYANYLVLNRSLLQSMPLDWQEEFVGLVHEMQASFSYLEQPAYYSVQCRNEKGTFIKDPIPHYERGRTRVERRPQITSEQQKQSEVKA